MERGQYLIICLLACAMRTLAGTWELSAEERNVVREKTICYSIERPGTLSLGDMTNMPLIEFDRLKVMTLKDDNDQPGLPYRIKVYSREKDREIIVCAPEGCTWKRMAEKLMVDEHLILDQCFAPVARNEDEAASDGVAKFCECEGRLRVELMSARWYDSYSYFDAGFGAVQDGANSARSGIPQMWSMFDDGMPLTMRSQGEMLHCNEEYVCAIAEYRSEGSSSGWMVTCRGEEYPFVVKIRIWTAGAEMSRSNALCIARVSGTLRKDAADIVSIECEKGAADFRAEVGKGAFGVDSRELSLYYKHALKSVSIGSNLTEQKLMECEADCTQRIRDEMQRKLQSRLCKRELRAVSCIAGFCVLIIIVLGAEVLRRRRAR